MQTKRGLWGSSWIVWNFLQYWLVSEDLPADFAGSDSSTLILVSITAAENGANFSDFASVN